MNEERLFDLDEGFTLYRTLELSDEIVHFLENTAFGTKDNLYRHYYIREFVANTPRRRQLGEAAPKALYATTLVINRDRQRRCSRRMNVAHQVRELRAIHKVSGEQDNPTDERMPEQFALLSCELRSLEIDH